MDPRSSILSRRLVALAWMIGPGAAIVLALALFGGVAPGVGLAALLGLVVAGGMGAWFHFQRIDALRSSLQALARSDAEGESRRALPGTSATLCAGLDTTIEQIIEHQRVKRRQLEDVVTGNEAILESLPDPLIMLDRERRIVRVNAAVTKSLGRDLPGRDLCEVFRAPALLEAADEVLAGGTGRIVEFSVPGRLEYHYLARVAGLPGPAPDGTIAILSLHDQTGIKRAERLRADFVANASHELRTPLASLLGFIETLNGPARGDRAAQAQFLTIMHDQAERMKHLVEDLLSLSRIEMKEHALPDGRVNLERLLYSVANTLELKAKDKDMVIRVQCEHLAAVTGDYDELTQVFQNLIDNALKYGRAGTEIRVSGAVSPKAAQKLQCKALAVAIADEGEGILPEHIPRLTERFYRVDTARSRQLGGTGLGLAIVKHIVSRHRGILDISSQVGKGSVFTVYLPMAEGADDVAAE